MPESVKDKTTEHIHPQQGGVRRSALAAWVIYDIGNTLFFAGIMGVLFPLWITQERSRDDATVGFTVAAAMALMLVVGPVAGAFSDQVGRRKPFLVASTLVCIGSTMLLGNESMALDLSLFALGIIGVSTATIFYNSLIIDVSTEQNRGTVSGIGVGVGYLGAIVAVSIGLVFVDPKGYVFAFRVIAILYLIVAMPLLLLLKEHPVADGGKAFLTRTSDTWNQLKATLRHMEQFPGLVRFLVAKFWYNWAVNTGSTFAVLYAIETVGFSERGVQLVLIAGIMVAIPSAFVWGKVVDRIGPGPVLKAMLIGWFVSFSIVVAIPWLGLPANLWWLVGIGTGILISGLWVADRPYMLQLTTPEYLGEFLGLHSMVGRLSAIVGPFSWGLISVTLGFGQTSAVLCLAGCIVISYLVMLGTDKGLKAPSIET